MIACLVVAFLCVLLAATDAPCLDPLIQWRLDPLIQWRSIHSMEVRNVLILLIYLLKYIYKDISQLSTTYLPNGRIHNGKAG